MIRTWLLWLGFVLGLLALVHSCNVARAHRVFGSISLRLIIATEKSLADRLILRPIGERDVTGLRLHDQARASIASRSDC
jgi:hypothetical protein